MPARGTWALPVLTECKKRRCCILFRSQTKASVLERNVDENSTLLSGGHQAHGEDRAVAGERADGEDAEVLLLGIVPGV